MKDRVRHLANSYPRPIHTRGEAKWKGAGWKGRLRSIATMLFGLRWPLIGKRFLPQIPSLDHVPNASVGFEVNCHGRCNERVLCNILSLAVAIGKVVSRVVAETFGPIKRGVDFGMPVCLGPAAELRLKSSKLGHLAGA